MRKVLLFVLIVTINFQCQKNYQFNLLTPHKKFITKVINGDDSFYALTKPDNISQTKSLAIGVFDSGIGGLTVFDAIINADFFNEAGEKQSDGKKDFKHEQFIYFADQANMPYSNYVEEGKKDLLVEHILKDALFLLNNKYHQSVNSPLVKDDKPNIKVMVIACNTATAYGKPQVEELLKVSVSGIKVIGVIEAGCKGALEVIREGEKATIAVLATPATVSSMAYVNTLNELKKDLKGVEIIQQGGKGLHEAIDNKREFINSKYSSPFPDYQGPSLSNVQYRINKNLLPWYKFDTTHYRMLFNRFTLELSDTIEINSVENYARYHIISLMEQLKMKSDTIPLRAIILGCTHYPYVSAEISGMLRELKQTVRYGYLLSDSIYIIDPALNTAKELYSYLAREGLTDTRNLKRLEESRFFVSVPNQFNPGTEIASDNRFTYEYQYKKRKINELKDYTLIVPLTSQLISDEQMNLIQKKLPFTSKLIKNDMK
jgi:glutamate racemase